MSENNIKVFVGIENEEEFKAEFEKTHHKSFNAVPYHCNLNQTMLNMTLAEVVESISSQLNIEKGLIELSHIVFDYEILSEKETPEDKS